MSATAGHAEAAASLIAQYEGVAFAEVHRQILHLIPTRPGRAVDIGTGIGQDAVALASMGHVVAVEPTAAFRLAAAALHPSPRITWLDDGLPSSHGSQGPST